MKAWEEIEEFLRSEAEADLAATGEVHPAFAAFRGDEPCFIAWLRWFPKGEYHDPLTELFALAMPLDADRIAASFGARLWSMEDPIPPVTADADLRQRAVCIHVVDGHARDGEPCSFVHPFELRGDPHTVLWQPRVELGRGEGWIPEAMELAVRHRRELATDDTEIIRQARRVAALGHRLWLPEPVAMRLDAV